MQEVLSEEIAILRAQLHNLNGRIFHLEVENAQLRASIAGPPALPAADHVYISNKDNAMYLPTVVESLAVMQEHFRRQGTLKQWRVPS